MSLIEAKKKLLMAQEGGVDVNELFNTSLWTGTGAARTITTGIDSGEGSSVWIKSRSSSSLSNYLFDTVRGATNYLVSNDTVAQASLVESLTSFGSSDFSIGTSTAVNSNGQAFVGWQFRRAEKFFDIVQYTGDGISGRTIAHNLGVVPGMIIVKNASASTFWPVQHITRSTDFGRLNTTNAFTATTGVWPSAATSTTFTTSDNAVINSSGNTYIAYIFAHDPSPEGLIQCGSYVGNGSATGPVVNLGWRPQYLMIKGATATGDWQMIDASRGFTSANDAILLANTSGAETSANLVNPDPTGFQLASTASNVNTNGQTYIYMAIREAI